MITLPLCVQESRLANDTKRLDSVEQHLEFLSSIKPTRGRCRSIDPRSLGRESDGGLFETLAPTPRLLGLLFRASEWMARYRDPGFVVGQLTDKTVDDETASIVDRDFRTAFEHGPTGAVRESRLFADDWSLPRPEAPVRVWHGVEDRNVSIDPVRDAYNALPDVSLSEIETDHLETLLSTREPVIRLAT